MSTDSDDLKRTFGKIAQLYDEGRPTYPTEIYDNSMAILKVSAPFRLLEVGCGTGKGTQLFVRDGHHLLATDISPELIAIAQAHFKDNQSIQFKVSSFEALDVPEASFDLIFSAQAFHWVDPEIRCRKAAHLLTPGGGVALFWNVFQFESTPLLRHVRDVCLTYVPAFAGWTDSSNALFEQMQKNWVAEINASGYFEPAQLSVLSRTLIYTPDQLLRLLTTYSWFQAQALTIQSSLLEALNNLLGDAPITLQVPVHTLLITAIKNPPAT